MPLNSFEEYVKEGIVKKVSKNKERAKSLLEESERKMRSLKERLEKLGIKDGDEIWVESQYGKDKAIARVTEGIHPEVVGWQHGFGHWGFGKIAKGKGTADGQFNVTKSDPVAGQALHKEVCVKVYKA